MNYFSYLIIRNLQRGVLIDTEPLLLFFVGACDKNRIQTSKCTKAFTVEDYDLLIQFMSNFKRIVTTPNILTEASNLLGYESDKIKRDFYTLFSSYVRGFEERFTPSKKIVIHEHFSKFGLTDLATLDNAKGRYLVLTVDLPLFGYLQNMGVDVINFNHLRTQNLLT